MLLGKRSRPPMKRTTSMTEFTLDLSIGFGGTDPAAPPPPPPVHPSWTTTVGDPRFLNSTLSPRPHRRNSADFQIETAHFLRDCFLCKRRLITGRDIYMYKGDSAFCSLECRQQQMIRDDRKEKSSAPSSAVTASGGNPEIVSVAAQVESIAAAAV